ncbi:MAG TPA: GDP-mannose 4,6-dehydratase [Tepidisphaeraceae bacterium]|nr:GDP-mannose 4,6-dehydratase [Tepidisphaeraceae bacterium]
MNRATDFVALHRDHYRDRRVFVTGGCGFIGSHVVDALVSLGANVLVYDNLSEGDRSNLPGAAKLIEADILNRDALERAMREHRAELVFHLAALVSVPRSVEMPGKYHEINTAGTLNGLDAARAAGVWRVMSSASSRAYGDAPELPKVETHPELPQSPYAATKLAGEQYVRAYARCYPMDAVSLRYFNIFGPRQKADSAYAGVVAAFAKALLNGRAPTIYGDGSASRDFTFVHNAVHANLLAGRREAPFKGEKINVATARATTVRELAETMARLLHRPDLAPQFAPPRPGDVLHSLADLKRARAELGYEPIVSFEQGIAQTLDWYKSQLA